MAAILACEDERLSGWKSYDGQSRSDYTILLPDLNVQP